MVQPYPSIQFSQDTNVLEACEKDFWCTVFYSTVHYYHNQNYSDLWYYCTSLPDVWKIPVDFWESTKSKLFGLTCVSWVSTRITGNWCYFYNSFCCQLLMGICLNCYIWLSCLLLFCHCPTGNSCWQNKSALFCLSHFCFCIWEHSMMLDDVGTFLLKLLTVRRQSSHEQVACNYLCLVAGAWVLYSIVLGSQDCSHR